MIFTSLFTSLLLATAAFAAPEGSPQRYRRLAERMSTPNRRLAETGLSAASNTSHVVYSSNWAGAVWDTYPSGSFYKVTGTFTVPSPSSPNGYASAWVGIDGDTCGTAILQTGVDFSYQNGAISYDTWYEWYPDYAYSFNTPIAVRAGDVIRLTVTASSKTSGTALIENLTTGRSESQFITSSYALCEQNAEWIVEDFSSGGGLVPFCNFGTVAFSNAYAYTNAGGTITPNGATVIDIQQNGQVLTSVSESSTGVTIKYV